MRKRRNLTVIVPDGRKGVVVSPPAKNSGLVMVVFPDADHALAAFAFYLPSRLKSLV